MRTTDNPVLVVAALPRADSPSGDRYVAEREGQTAWTMNVSAGGEVPLPEGILAQLRSSEHVSHQFDPATARARDLCATDLEKKAKSDRDSDSMALEKFQ